MIIELTRVLPTAASVGHSGGASTGSRSRREVVVRVHEPGIGRDDAVAVGVGVVAGEDVVLVASATRAAIADGDGRIHADLLVPVERHETPGRVDVGFTTVRSRPVHLGDERPVLDRCAAERVGADAHARAADRLDVDDVREVAHVRVAEVVVAERVAVDVLERRALHAFRARAISAFARSAIQPVASVSAGPPFGGLYLKPPSRGGLWLGVTTMPSARPGSAASFPRL
jgi:hypothetical protein